MSNDSPLSREIEERAANLRKLTEDDKKIAVLEREVSAARGQVNSLRKDNKRLVERNQTLAETLDQFANLSEQERIEARPIHQQAKRDSKHSAIAIVHWSDWHVAERVYKSKTNGRNAFNPEICKARVHQLVENTLSLIDVNRSHVAIDEMVLVLGGDFVTGYLHEELAQTNAMGVTEECYFAQSLLEGAVGTLLASADMKRIRIVCLRGNHSRTTRKMQFKNDFETSHETLIYWNLRDRLSGDGVEWVIPQADVSYTTLVKGVDLRVIHGHQVKYGGGVGGIAVPLTRWIIRQDQSRKAIATMLGHFHTFNPSALFSICGSLKGWDEFAQSHGFAFEEPSQLFMLFDCKREHLTARYPIFVE
jgi:regulator of replication initiation timing